MTLPYARAGTPLPVARGRREGVRVMLLRKARRWERRLPRSARARRAARPRPTAIVSGTASVHAPHAPSNPGAKRAPMTRSVWTDRLRRHFIEGLAATGNVRRTARMLGVHHTSFYRHRRANPGFAVQWKQAMTTHINEVIDHLMDRAAHGWEEDIWYRNEYIGKRRVYDHRMAMQLVQFVDKRDREDRAEAKAAQAEAADLAERYTGRRGARTGKSGEMHGGADGAYEDGTVSSNHALMLDLMHRHRNRHPQEWDGDVHKKSGFDFADWENWVAGYEARRKVGAAGKRI